MKKCLVEGCSAEAVTRGWCSKHYARWLRHGDTTTTLNNTGRSLEDRLWTRVHRTDDCWLWTGAVDTNGYGVLSVGGGQLKRAHCVSWVLSYGPIPQGMLVCHNCPDGDNPRCCRPDHLFLGTQEDNMRDAAMKGRVKTPRFSGAEHPQAQLSDDNVQEIRRRYTGRRGEQSALAREFGVTPTTVWRVVRGKGWHE